MNRCRLCGAIKGGARSFAKRFCDDCKRDRRESVFDFQTALLMLSEKGMPVAEMAIEFGVNAATVRRILTGREEPDATTAVHMARMFERLNWVLPVKQQEPAIRLAK